MFVMLFSRFRDWIKGIEPGDSSYAQNAVPRATEYVHLEAKALSIRKSV